MTRLANGHIKRNPDAAGRATRQPAAGGDVGVRREADLVQARVSGREGEAALVGVALVDDAVVVVEGLVDRDLDRKSVV